jgi:hypothetical protein
LLTLVVATFVKKFKVSQVDGWFSGGAVLIVGGGRVAVGEGG